MITRVSLFHTCYLLSFPYISKKKHIRSAESVVTIRTALYNYAAVHRIVVKDINRKLSGWLWPGECFNRRGLIES